MSRMKIDLMAVISAWSRINALMAQVPEMAADPSRARPRGSLRVGSYKRHKIRLNMELELEPED